jgi:hypothetical protein
MRRGQRVFFLRYEYFDRIWCQIITFEEYCHDLTVIYCGTRLKRENLMMRHGRCCPLAARTMSHSSGPSFSKASSCHAWLRERRTDMMYSCGRVISTRRGYQNIQYPYPYKLTVVRNAFRRTGRTALGLVCTSATGAPIQCSKHHEKNGKHRFLTVGSFSEVGVRLRV